MGFEDRYVGNIKPPEKPVTVNYASLGKTTIVQEGKLYNASAGNAAIATSNRTFELIDRATKGIRERTTQANKNQQKLMASQAISDNLAGKQLSPEDANYNDSTYALTRQLSSLREGFNAELNNINDARTDATHEYRDANFDVVAYKERRQEVHLQVQDAISKSRHPEVLREQYAEFAFKNEGKLAEAHADLYKGFQSERNQEAVSGLIQQVLVKGTKPGTMSKALNDSILWQRMDRNTKYALLSKHANERANLGDDSGIQLMEHYQLNKDPNLGKQYATSKVDYDRALTKQQFNARVAAKSDILRKRDEGTLTPDELFAVSAEFALPLHSEAEATQLLISAEKGGPRDRVNLFIQSFQEDIVDSLKTGRPMDWMYWRKAFQKDNVVKMTMGPGYITSNWRRYLNALSVSRKNALKEQQMAAYRQDFLSGQRGYGYPLKIKNSVENSIWEQMEMDKENYHRNMLEFTRLSTRNGTVCSGLKDSIVRSLTAPLNETEAPKNWAASFDTFDQLSRNNMVGRLGLDKNVEAALQHGKWVYLNAAAQSDNLNQASKQAFLATQDYIKQANAGTLPKQDPKERKNINSRIDDSIDNFTETEGLWDLGIFKREASNQSELRQELKQSVYNLEVMGVTDFDTKLKMASDSVENDFVLFNNKWVKLTNRIPIGEQLGVHREDVQDVSEWLLSDPATMDKMREYLKVTVQDKAFDTFTPENLSTNIINPNGEYYISIAHKDRPYQPILLSAEDIGNSYRGYQMGQAEKRQEGALLRADDIKAHEVQVSARKNDEFAYQLKVDSADMLTGFSKYDYVSPAFKDLYMVSTPDVQTLMRETVEIYEKHTSAVHMGLSTVRDIGYTFYDAIMAATTSMKPERGKNVSAEQRRADIDTLYQKLIVQKNAEEKQMAAIINQ